MLAQTHASLSVTRKNVGLGGFGRIGLLWGMPLPLVARPIQWSNIIRATGVVTVLAGIGTGWILGYLLLSGNLHT